MDLLQLVDALLDVVERHVGASLALVSEVHVFVILVIFINYSLKEIALGCESHAFDGLGAMSF